ncbi:protein YIF1B-A isoform X2 [Episyrphus balteatus]|uniref:protein YIF1B-A isoform X2 n=1 Tax=Episyrphus balteatus TaxID=286459 RepID=UPI002486A265|nr:protein YIF1B-A isoform X2 [Episyrphus balteatus]
MNYNPNPAAVRQHQGPRKPQRVSDISALGPAPVVTPQQQQYNPQIDPIMVPQNIPYVAGTQQAYNNGSSTINQDFQYTTIPQQPSQQQQQNYPSYPSIPPQQQQQQQQAGNLPNAPQMPQQFAMFQQPMVQDMAMQYGQRLADQGKQMVESQFEKYVPVAKLKYYFAVDNNYVINKLRLLFFPFTHKDWSLKYDQDNPVQPRYDINAPDLYIPTMAFITYVVAAGLMLGMQNRFSPEQLGIQASSALAYSIFELVVYSITLYVVNIKTSLKTLDLLAFSGYKFVIIVACLLTSTIFHSLGYYLALIYSSLTLGFFLLRTLKTKVLLETTAGASDGPINYDPYGNPQQLDYTGDRKRKLYFLFLVVGGQAFLSFLLSKHLFLREPTTPSVGELTL